MLSFCNNQAAGAVARAAFGCSAPVGLVEGGEDGGELRPHDVVLFHSAPPWDVLLWTLYHVVY